MKRGIALMVAILHVQWPFRKNRPHFLRAYHLRKSRGVKGEGTRAFSRKSTRLYSFKKGKKGNKLSHRKHTVTRFFTKIELNTRWRSASDDTGTRAFTVDLVNDNRHLGRVANESSVFWHWQSGRGVHVSLGFS